MLIKLSNFGKSGYDKKEVGPTFASPTSFVHESKSLLKEAIVSVSFGARNMNVAPRLTTKTTDSA
jgi:hypothetical protein